MPRYLTSHNMACMTRQGAIALADVMRSATEVEFLRLIADMTFGRLIGEFNASSREIMQGWLDKNRIHCDSMHRIDFEATPDGVRNF